jgi:CheY-like chemotaxis protein
MTRKIQNILVVDDDPSIQELIRIILTRNGYNVHQAIDGGDGIEKYLELKPDLVISDIAMPAGDGFNVAIYISNKERECRTTPVLLISAFYDEYSNRENAERCGADGFLPKPFTQKELIEAIELVKA